KHHRQQQQSERLRCTNLARIHQPWPWRPRASAAHWASSPRAVVACPSATDGYDAVQVGYHGVREDKLTRPELGHLGKASAPPLRHLQEFRLVAVDAFDPGQALEFNELFKEGDLVDVSAKSIGKGFQGERCFDPNSVSCQRLNHPVYQRLKLPT
uniref:Uncharacterized protein n=1 Tax=Aegilops tauschii subsp. strangulata TaxID=200361 RepID=A0A453N8P8_AEGTS